MKLFNRFGRLPVRAARREDLAEVQARVERWSVASQQDPNLATDLVALGGVLSGAPRDQLERLAADPAQLAYDQGRRDLAVELLAMMRSGQQEFLDLMEANNV